MRSTLAILQAIILIFWGIHALNRDLPHRHACRPGLQELLYAFLKTLLNSQCIQLTINLLVISTCNITVSNTSAMSKLPAQMFSRLAPKLPARCVLQNGGKNLLVKLNSFSLALYDQLEGQRMPQVTMDIFSALTLSSIQPLYSLIHEYHEYN